MKRTPSKAAKSAKPQGKEPQPTLAWRLWQIDYDRMVKAGEIDPTEKRRKMSPEEFEDFCECIRDGGVPLC